MDWESKPNIKRLAEVQRYVERISRAFNASWTPALSLRHQRALIVLPDPIMDPRNVLPLCVPAEAPEARLARSEVLSLLESPERKTKGEAKLRKDYGFMYFLGDYHDYMEKARLSYSSVKDRIRAVQEMHDSIAAVTSVYPSCSFQQDFHSFPDPVSAYKAIHGRSAKACTRDACGKSGAKFALCSGCQVSYYCSRECSVADWPNHKEKCKVWGKNK